MSNNYFFVYSVSLDGRTSVYGISQNTSGLNSLTAVALEDLIKPYYKVSLVIIMNNIEIIIGIIRVNQALL